MYKSEKLAEKSDVEIKSLISWLSLVTNKKFPIRHEHLGLCFCRDVLQVFLSKWQRKSLQCVKIFIFFVRIRAIVESETSYKQGPESGKLEVIIEISHFPPPIIKYIASFSNKNTYKLIYMIINRPCAYLYIFV